MTARLWTAGAALAALAGLALLIARPSRDARIVWWKGRAVRWAGERGVTLSPEGDLVAFRRGRRPAPLSIHRAARTLLDAALDGRGRIWLADGEGTILRREADGSLAAVGRTPFDLAAVAAGSGEGLWVARSPVQFTFKPETTQAPLAARLDTLARTRSLAGTITIPDNPFLAQLANASQILPLEDGGVVLAPFIRDEVLRLGRNGRLAWRTVRGLTHATPNPSMTLEQADGRPRVVVDYAPVNLGLAQGPDGTIYVLSTPSATTAASRLDALDPATGRLLRSWRFETALPSLALTRSGEIVPFDPDTLLRPSGAEPREPFASFALPALTGDTLRSANLAGRVVLVNFWASWCAPCREELPALDSLAGTYDTTRVVFVALSDDVSRGAARAFVAAHPLRHMRVALGGGRLKGRYHYIGLPHTALLDAEGRVMAQWSGYTGSGQVRTVAERIAAELARAPSHLHSH
jgi:thiol-disulfide isomerase/thioredoxin